MIDNTTRRVPPSYPVPADSDRKTAERSWLGMHEIKHDGYRLQIHVRDGWVCLFTRNGSNWTDRYPWMVEDAAKAL